MKVFLDDVRDPPDASWTRANTVAEAFDLIASEHASGRPIEALSLDFDLGMTCPQPHDTPWQPFACEHTNGLELVVLMQMYGFKAHAVMVHTQNPSGRRLLLASIPLISVDPVGGSIPEAGRIIVPAPKVLLVRNEDN